MRGFNHRSSHDQPGSTGLATKEREIFVNIKKLAIIAGLMLCLVAPVRAQDIANKVADGAAWMTEGPQGGTIMITFFPDGTGQAGSGLFSRRLTWQGEGDRLCLMGLPGAASGCMQLTKTDKGYSGLREDGTALILWR